MWLEPRTELLFDNSRRGQSSEEVLKEKLLKVDNSTFWSTQTGDWYPHLFLRHSPREELRTSLIETFTGNDIQQIGD